ncbi:O-antigen ligase family protein [Gloeobacter kilaueensis]|uniref:O-antigen polymerase n=1 Tax=Gloeobacter kilaueensis (strain ATCC BAA-2537 / CCAP 1431/1 / ULC 316 / JS1) TaxID=1183438 RepID=U5QLS9_GLOK1|nr:O-antigen ligase family protein [Gloeobacter kilaueensis]AGY58645.1 O-antigen polymerase [Gloeobacter kilaueensis JS1]
MTLEAPLWKSSWNLLVVVSIGIGVAAARSPLLLAAFFVAAIGVSFLARHFTIAVLVLLTIRSSLDPFGRWQLASLLALGIDAILAFYVLGCLLLHRPIKGDWWGIFLLLWVAAMSFWPVASYLGWLGEEPPEAFGLCLREWIRFVSYAGVYWLVMQLRDTISPQRVLDWLLLSLVAPTSVAFAQLALPIAALPYELRVYMHNRIYGTLGHPNTLAVYLVLMAGLVWWKYATSHRKRWLALLALLGFLFINTNSLSGIAMLPVLVGMVALPRLNLKGLVGAAIALTLVLGIFANTDMGRERLNALRQTPILNGDFNLGKAARLAHLDDNSFAWRIAQWSYLVRAWEQAPVLGHGLGTTAILTPYRNDSHNDFVRALAETGAVGFCLFVLMWGTLSVRVLSLWRGALPDSPQRELCWVLLSIYCATTVGMLAEHYWQTTTFFFYWWAALAVAGWPWPAPAAPISVQTAPLLEG